MIRHAEKPGRAGEGLSEIGKRRAQCLRTVFGAESEFDFGLVFAAPRDASKADQERTWMTVAPVAQDLGLEVDILCANEPASCVRERVEAFAEHSSADVLISWKHHDLLNMARALGVDTTVGYPDDRFDIMWIIEGQRMVEKRSEHCPLLDDGVVDGAVMV
ncbi:hypothetical protein BDY24DRAFT_392532 [Mrakia frigida]|uniref:uncharacterized protein n=1 Tax=Mrakia frigida TaxID=29902 RepID=UPI003FCC0598